jgi:hypothetical protein
LEYISTQYLDIITPLQISYNLIFFFVFSIIRLQKLRIPHLRATFRIPTLHHFSKFQPHANHVLILLARRAAGTSSMCRSADYRYTLIHLCSSLATNDIHNRGINLWQTVKRTAIYVRILNVPDVKVDVLGNSQ